MFIENSKNKKLEYLVIDKHSKIFDDFRNNVKEYSYLERLDSERLNQIENYDIFKINYDEYDKMNEDWYYKIEKLFSF